MPQQPCTPCRAGWKPVDLVSLEAALSGTPLVGSTFGHELEYLEGDAWYADPGDATALEKLYWQR